MMVHHIAVVGVWDRTTDRHWSQDWILSRSIRIIFSSNFEFIYLLIYFNLLLLLLSSKFNGHEFYVYRNPFSVLGSFRIFVLIHNMLKCAANSFASIAQLSLFSLSLDSHFYKHNYNSIGKFQWLFLTIHNHWNVYMNDHTLWISWWFSITDIKDYICLNG